MGQRGLPKILLLLAAETQVFFAQDVSSFLACSRWNLAPMGNADAQRASLGECAPVSANA